MFRPFFSLMLFVRSPTHPPSVMVVIVVVVLALAGGIVVGGGTQGGRGAVLGFQKRSVEKR